MLGLGLISGSLARALKTSDWQGEILGWGPREPSLERGQALGVIDGYTLDLAQLVSHCDLLVIGAPPVATGELLAQLLPMAEAALHRPIVTDLASIKGWVVAQAAHSYARFVPGHPIAGSEHSGVDASRADLFAGREVILTPTHTTDSTATEQVRSMWQLTGARVAEMSIADHDAVLAASSHSPHMVAYALTMALSKDPLNPMQHGGGALRDMTRIAGSDPLMWRDVALTNKDALLQAMANVSAELESLRELIATEDALALHDYFDHCRRIRRNHDRVLNPMLDDIHTRENES
jgi:prephenate dehydrogenase